MNEQCGWFASGFLKFCVFTRIARWWVSSPPVPLEMCVPHSNMYKTHFDVDVDIGDGDVNDDGE